MSTTTFSSFIQDLYFEYLRDNLTLEYIDPLETRQSEISDQLLTTYSIDNLDRFSIKVSQIIDAIDNLREELEELIDEEESEEDNWEDFVKEVWDKLQMNDYVWGEDLDDFDKVRRIIFEAALVQKEADWLVSMEAENEIALMDEDGMPWEDIETYFYADLLHLEWTHEILFSEIELPRSIWESLLYTKGLDVRKIFETSKSWVKDVYGLHRIVEDKNFLPTILNLKDLDYYIDDANYFFNAASFTPTQVLEQVEFLVNTLRRIEDKVPQIEVKDTSFPGKVIYASHIKDADIAKMIESKRLGMQACLITDTPIVRYGSTKYEDGLYYDVPSEFAPHIDTVYLAMPDTNFEPDIYISLTFPNFKGQFTVLTNEASLDLLGKNNKNHYGLYYKQPSPSLYLHIDAGDNASLSIELYDMCETFDLRVTSKQNLTVDFLDGLRDYSTARNLSLSVDTGPKTKFLIPKFSIKKLQALYMGYSIPELIRYKTDYKKGKESLKLSNVFPTQFEVMDKTAIAYNKSFSKYGTGIWLNLRRKVEFKVVYLGRYPNKWVGNGPPQFPHLNSRGAVMFYSDFTTQIGDSNLGEKDARGAYIHSKIIDSNDFTETCVGATLYKCFFIDKVPEKTLSIGSLNDEVDITII